MGLVVALYIEYVLSMILVDRWIVGLSLIITIIIKALFDCINYIYFSVPIFPELLLG